MKKSIGYSIVMIGSLIASGMMIVSTTKTSFVKSTTTDFTITLNSSNKYNGNNKAIDTDSGQWTINFSYSNCQVSSNGHAIMLPESTITNTDPIHYITDVTATFDDDLYISFSSDAVNWSAEQELTSGTKLNIDGTNHYFKLYTDTGANLVSMQIKYACTEAPLPTYNVADYYNGYYSSIVSWTDGEDLKQQLHDVISGGEYTPISYNNPNWESNVEADHSQDSYLALDVVYSSTDALASSTQKAWQREHAFCASLMTGSLTSEAVKHLGRATDFHNLFAGDASGNGSRGNKNFGYADTSKDSYQDRTTNNGIDGYSFDNKNFEPGDKDKGRLARAIFYMCTMYKDPDYDEKNDVNMAGLQVVDQYVDYSKDSTSGENCAFAIGNKQDLLEWNSFPVDRLEMQHNVSVQTFVYNGHAQGNRNPYVDYPELVDYVFGSKSNQSGRLENIKPSAIDLDSNSKEHRYYTLRSAKQSFGVGTTFSNSNIVIYDVKKDFSFTTYQGSYTTSLDGHTFSTDDGKTINNTISINSESLLYSIAVESMTTCAFYSATPKSSLTNAVGSNQSVTWGGKTFNFYVEGTSGYTFQNNNGTGGMKMGSGTKAISKVIFTSVESFDDVDSVYFRGKAGNANSSWTLKIYIGHTLVMTKTVTCTTATADYGGAITPTSGQVKFEFTGTNALWSDAIAFNY